MSFLRSLLRPLTILLAHGSLAMAAQTGTAGDLFVSNWGSAEVTQYDDQSGQLVGVFTNTGITGAGLMFHPGGELVWASSSAVSLYDGQSGQLVQKLSTAGSAQHRGMTLGPTGDLFVADRTGRVLRYDLCMKSYLGEFVNTALVAPADVEFGPGGDLFVSDVGLDQVLEFDGTTGALNGVLIQHAALVDPTGLLFRRDGSLLVASQGTDQVLEFDSGGAFVRVFATGGSLSLPIDLIEAPNGNVWVASSGSNEVLEFDGTTGAFVRVFANLELDQPWGLCVKPAPIQPVVPGQFVGVHGTVPEAVIVSASSGGDLYVGRQTYTDVLGDAPIHRIRNEGTHSAPYGPLLMDPDAAFLDEAGAFTSTRGAVIVGGICNATQGCLYEILPDQSMALLHGPSSIYFNPYDFAVDSQGRLVFTDHDSAGGALITYQNGVATRLTGTGATAASIAIDDADRIHVSDSTGTVQVYDANGALIDASLVSGLGLDPPVAIGPGGIWGTDLYTVRCRTGELLRVAADGTEIVVGTGFFGQCRDLEFGADGSLYVAQLGYDRVLRVHPFGLDASSATVAAGDSLTFRCGAGQPGKLLFLSVVDVNGTPLFQRFLFGVFPPTGEWIQTDAVPPGLAGLDVTFVAIGFAATGRLGVTNPERVQFL